MVALSDKNVAPYLQKHFLGTVERVGSFLVSDPQGNLITNSEGEVVRRFRGMRVAEGQTTKQGGNVVTYFCTPQMEVIHLVIGPVHGSTLQKEAKWAVETYATAKAEAVVASDVSEAIRLAHHLRVPAADHDQFRSRLESYREKFAETESDQRALFQAAKTATWGYRQHLALSKIGMCNLADMEEDSFEVFAGQPYQRRTKRQDGALQMVNRSVAKNKPVLIWMDDPQSRGWSHTQSRGGAGYDAGQQWVKLRNVLRSSRRLRQGADEFTVLSLNYNEASTLADDLNHRPIPADEQGYPCALLIDGAGNRNATVFRAKHGYSVLTVDGKERQFERELDDALYSVMQQTLARTPRAKEVLASNPLEDAPVSSVATQPSYYRFVGNRGQFVLLAHVRGGEGEKVQLVMQGDQSLSVPFDQFSKAEQAYISAALAAQRRDQSRLKRNRLKQALGDGFE
ncbi:MAG: hypothetical protein CL681_03320 [Blastopirellula sp.]|nr:hypothetical protein [Blastopirellula sp.]